MQIASFEASWPVLAAIKWDRQYHAMLATPLRIRDVILAHQAFIASRMLTTAAVYFIVIAAFGAVESPLGVLAIPVTRARRALAYSAPHRRLGGAHADRGLVRRDLPLHHPPDVPLLGDVLPDLDACRAARAARLAHAALAWRRLSAAILTLGEVVARLDLLHVAYLLAFVAAGLAIAARHVQRRLVV